MAEPLTPPPAPAPAAAPAAQAPGRVQVVAPDGTIGTLPQADLDSGSAAAAGFRPATAEDLAEHAAKQAFESGGAQVRTAAEGVARGLSLGLSDVAATAFGAEREGLLQRKERNPLAATAGEVLGAAAPAFATGGESLVARGLAATPAGLAARAGLAVERGLVGQAAPGALRRIGATALGAATEGAIQGVGTAISEAELREDVDLTAELLMSHVGAGALIGGTAGGALKGLEVGAQAVGRVTREGLERVFGEARGALGKGGAGAERAAGAVDEALDGVPRKLPDGSPNPDAPDGKTPLGRMWDDADKAARIDETHQEVLRAFERDASALEAGLDRTTAKLTGLKPQKIRQAMAAAPPPPDVPLEEATALVERLGSQVQDLLARQGDFVAERGAVQALRAMEKRLNSFAKSTSADPADLFHGLDKTKQTLGHLSSNLNGRAIPGEGAPITVGDHLRSLYEDMRVNLENPAIWGEGAAGMQQRVNRAWTRYFDSNSAYNSKYLTDDITPAANPFRDLRKADARKAGGVFRTLGRAETDFDERVLREAVDARAELADVLEREYGSGQGAAELRDLAKRVQGHADRMKGELAAAQRFADRAGQSTLVGGAGGALVGLAVGGPLGAAAGAGAGAALGSKLIGALQAATKLTRLQGAADGVLVRVQNAVKRGLEVGGKAVRAGRSAAQSELGEREGRTKESHAEEYERRSKAVRDWAAAPQLGAARIAKATAPFEDAAPGVSAALAQRSAQAADFLASKLPRDRPSSDLLRPDLDKTGRISERERARFLRYARAVDQGPEGIVKAFERGSMTREQGEVLRTLYPALHQRITRQVANEVASRTEPVPYRKLLDLSLLLGVPLHASLTPESIARAQSAYAPQPAPSPPPQPTGVPTQTAQSEMSRAQQISQRGAP